MVALAAGPGGLGRSLLLGLGLLVASSAVLATGWPAGRVDPVSMLLSAEVDSAGYARVQLTRVEEELLRRLSRRGLKNGDWENLIWLAVDRASTPVAGKYLISRNGLELISAFPVIPGVKYVATVDPRQLYARTGLAPQGDLTRLTVPLVLPLAGQKPSALVSRVYPTGELVPENLLKFYLEFSAPMREGEAARSITLLDQAGVPVPSAFLGLETELWDAGHRRLTLYLDPGRIKRGLRPNQELGPPLVAGRKYQLLIAAGWRDADGVPLLRGYQKLFAAGPADRAGLRLADWKVEVPGEGSTDPLLLAAPEPLDVALARRMVRVTGRDGAPVSVSVEVTDRERRLRLTPRVPWSSGEYTIVLDAGLEDLAGNTFQRPFDADLDDSSTTPHDELGSVGLKVRIGRAAF